MRWIACLFIGFGVTAGCQRGSGNPPPPVAEPYRSDIENVCNVVTASGADQLAPAERALTVASWLAAHLQTQEARDYLVKIQPLTGEPKAAVLEAEARRVGLARCLLAAEWRDAAPPRL